MGDRSSEISARRKLRGKIGVVGIIAVAGKINYAREYTFVTTFTAAPYLLSSVSLEFKKKLFLVYDSTLVNCKCLGLVAGLKWRFDIFLRSFDHARLSCNWNPRTVSCFEKIMSTSSTLRIHTQLNISTCSYAMFYTQNQPNHVRYMYQMSHTPENLHTDQVLYLNNGIF